MSKKKNKFDLTHLIHAGALNDGQVLFYVSDPKQNCKIQKQPNGEFKVTLDSKEVLTIHAFAQKCLNQEPPDHASKWVRTEQGKTLYELWQNDLGDEAA